MLRLICLVAVATLAFSANAADLVVTERGPHARTIVRETVAAVPIPRPVADGNVHIDASGNATVNIYQNGYRTEESLWSHVKREIFPVTTYVPTIADVEGRCYFSRTNATKAVRYFDYYSGVERNAFEYYWMPSTFETAESRSRSDRKACAILSSRLGDF